MTITPEQFNQLVTKHDLQKALENMASKKDVQIILGTLDAINKTISTREDEGVANTAAHDRMQESIDDHEKRVTKLEVEMAAV